MHEEGPNKVSLVPGVVLVEDPFQWILEWIHHIMKVNQHARSKARQHLEKLVMYIASTLHNVCGVDEQYVVAFQFSEAIQRDILYRRFDDLEDVGRS